MLVEEKLKLLMQEVCQSRREVEEKLESSLAEVQGEVNAAQEKMSQDIARKIGSTSYQFHKKGHEHQYNFNCGVEEAISSTHTEVTKVKSSALKEREALKKELGMRRFCWQNFWKNMLVKAKSKMLEK